ncbi:MAG: PEP-CTERM system histidine kinase PrsK [Burkholderiaceae bacterium]
MLTAEWYLNPAAWSYGLATLAFAVFAVQLSLGWNGGRASFFLLAAIILSAFWAAATCSFAVLPGAPMWVSARVFDVLAIGALLAFLASLFVPARGQVRRPLWLMALVAAVVLGALLLPVPPPSVPDLGRGMHAWAFSILLAQSVLGLVLVEQIYRRTAEPRRWNVRPLCVGLAGWFAFDLVLYADAMMFRVLDEPLWAARGIAHALVIPFLGIAASRNRQWDLEVTISRGVLTQSSTLLVVGLYLLGVSGAGYYVRFFGGSWGVTLAAVLVFAALLLLAFIAISETFRAKLRVLVAKNFFAYRYDYREEWLAFTRTVSAAASEASVQSRCITALADLVESTGGSLWLRQGEGGYGEAERTVSAPVAAIEPAGSALVRFLAGSGWVLDLNDVRRDPEKYDAAILPEWIAEMPNAWLVVPLLNGDDLVGFVVLARSRVSLDPNWEVWDLLKTAGTQAASYLALFQATEALLEARKFDAFNRMSAFVVHDLKNLVAQLQLMLRNAERHAANPEFQRDMLRTVEHVVGRMNHLMLQLRSGESPIDKPRAVDLAALVRSVHATRVANPRALQVEAAVGVWALGHEDRLERVVAHLIQNGIDAAGEGARVAVRTWRDGDFAVVEIKDNGMGMTQDFIQNQLFKPFASTKDKGMGIGAYESHQYVTALGGRIAVESTPGHGTTVRVFLLAAAPQGRLHAVEEAA